MHNEVPVPHNHHPTSKITTFSSYLAWVGRKTQPLRRRQELSSRCRSRLVFIVTYHVLVHLFALGNFRFDSRIGGRCSSRRLLVLLLSTICSGNTRKCTSSSSSFSFSSSTLTLVLLLVLLLWMMLFSSRRRSRNAILLGR